MCYYEPKNVVICRVCNVAVHNYVRLIEPGGVSVADMTTFLEQPRTADPALATKHKKLNPEQLANRLLAAKGGWTLTLAEHDVRTGGSGPVIDPDTESEWVKTEDSPPDANEESRQSDRLMVGGVMCEVVDGEWVPIESK
jgi:hypothetical protein